MEASMRKIIFATALTLMCGSAFAQSTGAPAAAQNDMNKPGMNNNMDKGAMDKGTMGKGSMSNTTGMTGSANGSPSKAPKATTGPNMKPSASETPPK
jgi:pentapeptide MXKDX repeat protein